MAHAEPGLQEPAPAVEPVPVGATPRWRRGHSLIWMGIEVVLISMSVFLGLAGQQWLEDRQHREQGQDALRRFRTEITANRAEITRKSDYHLKLNEALTAYFKADAKTRQSIDPGQYFTDGLQPLFFQRTAWDLALATQSLTYIDSDLAFGISGVYQFQDLVMELGRGVTQAMYSRGANSEGFTTALKDYYSDMSDMEPGLLKAYDAVLPLIEAELVE